MKYKTTATEVKAKQLMMFGCYLLLQLLLAQSRSSSQSSSRCRLKMEVVNSHLLINSWVFCVNQAFMI